MRTLPLRLLRLMSRFLSYRGFFLEASLGMETVRDEEETLS